MTEIMPVPRILILLSYQQRAYRGIFIFCAKREADAYRPPQVRRKMMEKVFQTGKTR